VVAAIDISGATDARVELVEYDRATEKLVLRAVWRA
jgi:hypothetical protein